MNKFSALVQKELRIYFNSPIAYIFLIVFLAFSSWFFFKGFFLIGQVQMHGFFGILPWVFLFLIPALTMRSWSEEFKQGTVETLLTSSASLPQVIGAKAMAGLVFLIIALVLTLPIPLSINYLGNLDWGVTIAGYIGALFLGGAYLALGLFISALTNNQIVAFIISISIAFMLFIMGEPIVTFALPGGLTPLLEFIGLGSHYNSIARGVLDSRDVIYYASFIFFFLYLNTEVLKKRI